MKGTKIATDAPQLLSVAGHLVEPISPTAVSAQDRLTTGEMREINSTWRTWAFNELFLRTLILQLWKRVDETQMGLREVPLLKESLTGFPYCYSSGTPALVSEEGTKFITEKSAADPCLYCLEVPSNWRGHMGGHILRKMRRAGETDRDKKAKHAANTQIYPEVGDSFEISTKCKYTVIFQYQTANKGSATMPSHNIPVICSLCPKPAERYPTYPAIWCYNMAQHLREVHSEYVSLEQPEGNPLSFKVWQSARIDAAEEIALSIPESLVPRLFTRFIQESEEESWGQKQASGGGGRGRSKRGRSKTAG
ncbi:hypothetical protein B0H14DRAFT_3512290 [Mycena olivaceomarginata]|nr:hypothetical protein B0H14DRAFT_3512290 [Mycena olivaceomarginata]